MGQIYFDDVREGHEIGPLYRGPLTTAHLMRWSAAIENWHKIHYDREFAKEHDHLPDLLIHGSLKQQFIVKLLTDWAGDNGWVWKVRFQFRAMNPVGERLAVWARTTAMRRTEHCGLIEFDLGIRNDAGKESTPGSAVVALPYRGGPSVPYPFQPPA